jgi:hypothetical protein
MRLTSLYRHFLEADSLGFKGDEDDKGIAVDADDDDDAAAAAVAKTCLKTK